MAFSTYCLIPPPYSLSDSIIPWTIARFSPSLVPAAGQSANRCACPHACIDSANLSSSADSTSLLPTKPTAAGAGDLSKSSEPEPPAAPRGSLRAMPSSSADAAVFFTMGGRMVAILAFTAHMHAATTATKPLGMKRPPATKRRPITTASTSDHRLLIPRPATLTITPLPTPITRLTVERALAKPASPPSASTAP